uniref:Carbonic anhydrase n=1 Tax=Arion vulgaris TaxID=1028688 RepID=A0A0B7AZZ1_9EUPU
MNMLFLKKGFQHMMMMFAVVVVLISLNVRPVDGDAVSWNYQPGNYGSPENWYLQYPDCGGVMQSPIDINTTKVLYDPNLQPFNFDQYGKTTNITMDLENVGGHTAEVIYSGDPVYLTGGSLPDKYILEQFHFHWGQKDTQGSEHAINGAHYPVEAHFVHRQSHLPNASVASSHPFGLAVIAVFFKIGKENANFNKLLDYFPNITEANNKVRIPTFAVKDLLPVAPSYDYFRYQGSLTTPPCYESVIWSILLELIEISDDQLDMFRELNDEEHHSLVDDFRPDQPLNQRTILSTNPIFKTRDPGGAASSCVPDIISMLLAVLTCFIMYFI